MKEEKKMGRPADYNNEIVDKICEILSTEIISVKSLCDRDDMPSHATFYRWLSTKKDFQDKYARARETQADLMAEDILRIADDTSGDIITIETDNGPVERCNTEWVQRSKLKIEARKWLASKLLPKKYGEKLDINQKITKVGKDLDDEKYE